MNRVIAIGTLPSFLWVMIAGLIAGVSSTAPTARGGVVAYWRFEPGNLTADSSPSGTNTLTNFGVTSSTTDKPASFINSGSNGGSAVFDGASRLITSSTLNLSTYSQLTIEWFSKPTTPGTSVGMIVEGPYTNTGNANNTFYAYQTATGYDSAYFNAGGNDHLIWTTGLSGWHHFALELDANNPSNAGGTEMRLFKDGLLVSPGTEFHNAAADAFADAILNIGARNNTDTSPSAFYDGLIDEIRISSGLLSPSEFLIPEPSTLGVLALSAIVASRRRRRA